MTDLKKTGRRQSRGETRRLAVLDAARTLFIAHGYRGTTLAQIIALAGGSKETIYKTLGGKVGIFAAIIAQTGERLAASIVASDTLAMEPRQELTRLGHELAAIWNSGEARAVHEVVLSEGLKSPELVEAWYRGSSALVIDALERYLVTQIANGSLAALDAPLVARQFVTLLMGELAFPFIGGMHHQVPVEDHVARCVDLFIKAYGAKPA